MQCMIRMLLEHLHPIFISHLIYHPKKLLYPLYHTILQYLSIPNFYFPILLIKIIYLHNKIIFLHNQIIYPPITVIYSFFLILYIQQPQILQKTPSPHAHHRPPPLHYTHLTPLATHNLPSTKKKKTQTIKNQTPQPNADHPNTTPITDHPKKKNHLQKSTAQRQSPKHRSPTTQHRSPHHTQTPISAPNPKRQSPCHHTDLQWGREEKQWVGGGLPWPVIMGQAMVWWLWSFKSEEKKWVRTERRERIKDWETEREMWDRERNWHNKILVFCFRIVL